MVALPGMFELSAHRLGLRTLVKNNAGNNCVERARRKRHILGISHSHPNPKGQEKFEGLSAAARIASLEGRSRGFPLRPASLCFTGVEKSI